MTQDMQEPTENVKPELYANWSSPIKIPESEPDIDQNDIVPPISKQAELSGWECNYYSFGKLDGQGTEYFNPSLVMRDDGIWLLTRASGLHPRGFMYGQNAIVAFKLDDAGKQPHHGKVLHWPVDNPMQHFEDPRGFYHPGLGQTLIGACTFLWNGPGDWTGALQAFGAFDDQWLCKKMDYPKIGGNPGLLEKVLPKNYEKNWVWWLHENKLHLLYKADPWTVYVFNNRWSERTDYKSDGITWPYGEIRGGTSPVQIGDMFFTFHHSSLPWKGRYRRYYAGALGFDVTPPYKPRLITSEPLLIGSQNDTWAQRKPLVVFPCGALYLKDRWLVSMGVNDLKSAWLELSHESLLERMRPVEDVTGQIFQSAIPEMQPLGGAKNVVDGSQPEIGGATSIDPTAQTTLEKRRAALVKARAARAAKNILGGEARADNAGSEAHSNDVGTASPARKPRKRRRRRRTKAQMAEARAQALREYEGKKQRVSVFADGREMWADGSIAKPQK